MPRRLVSTASITARRDARRRPAAATPSCRSAPSAAAPSAPPARAEGSSSGFSISHARLQRARRRAPGPDRLDHHVAEVLVSFAARSRRAHAIRQSRGMRWRCCGRRGAPPPHDVEPQARTQHRADTIEARAAAERVRRLGRNPHPRRGGPGRQVRAVPGTRRERRRFAARGQSTSTGGAHCAAAAAPSAAASRCGGACSRRVPLRRATGSAAAFPIRNTRAARFGIGDALRRRYHRRARDVAAVARRRAPGKSRSRRTPSRSAAGLVAGRNSEGIGNAGFQRLADTAGVALDRDRPDEPRGQ